MNSNKILKIKKTEHNRSISKNYIITGNEKTIKLDLEIVDDEEMENNFGIICYDKQFKYGNKKHLSSLNKISEPLRILIDEILFDLYINHIKKLIILNTEKEDINYETLSFKELLKNFSYDILYKKYDKNDLQNRNTPLPGKYNDSIEIYQNNETKNAQ